MAMRYLQIALACCICVLLIAGPAKATTYTVTNTNNTGAGSLDQAILDANAHAGKDTVAFNIPGAGPHYIFDDSLPYITEYVLFDGFTEPGSSPNTNYAHQGINAVLMINLTGMLEVGGSNTVIRGLAINSDAYSPGIELKGSGGHFVEGCFLGTDITGTVISSREFGVEVISDGNTIGGTTPAARNLISGNYLPGIRISGDANYVWGNLIGTDVTGTVALGNGQDPVYDAQGIFIEGNNNIIGSPTLSARNVISGNTADGIRVLYGDGNVIYGNYIGTDVSGMVDLGNGGWGIDLTSAANLISVNESGGISLTSGPVSNVRIWNNKIGTDATGSSPLSNGGDGVYISSGSGVMDVELGGTNPLAPNVIAHNAGNGISVLGSAGGVDIRRNSIHSNTGLGIDLAGDGVTPNDPLDSDTGPNDLQNFPEFTVVPCGGGLEITGTLHSTPDTEFDIDFFSTPSCDPSGHGEGAVFLGTTSVTTNGVGNAGIAYSLGALPAGHQVTATATNPDNSTSEFSPCAEVGSGLVVTNTNSTGPGSLYEACLTANICAGLDTISFNIPGAGPHTIEVTEPLPRQTGPVLIDGYTQPGSSPNTNPRTVGSNAVLKIEIDGTNYHGSGGDRGTCFEIRGGNSVVRGLAINRFAGGPAIIFDVGGGNKVEGCFLGTDVTGWLERANLFGVYVFSNNNTIGGVSAMARNVISGNQEYGVAAVGDGNMVFGNLIGTAATGTNANGNGIAGVYVQGTNNSIGGITLASRNVISANSGPGVHLDDCEDNDVCGNYIGTDVTGSVDFGNSLAGVFIQAGSGHWIGGTSAGFRNIISGNSGSGVFIVDASLSNIIAGNYIGTNAAGTGALPNSGHGVEIWSCNGNTVGGPNALYRNVISGNNGDAVRIDAIAFTNVVQANYIGTDHTGTNPLGNGGNGVYVYGANNTIGGAGAEEGNIIAHNGDKGIHISDYSANLIRRNSIFGNVELGIDLGGDGVTLNDLGDPDSGSNALQNFPVITSASGGTNCRIVGSLNSTPNTSFTIDFFYSPMCDETSYGEGKHLIGSLPVGTDGSGNASFDMIFSTVVPGGSYVTATATSSGNNTSEFSQCVEYINTKSGNNVTVFPVDEETGETPVQVTFDSVIGEGNTTLEITESGPPVPGEFIVGDPATYYHLSTTAIYDDSITVYFVYDDSALPGAEEDLKIIHYDTTLVPPDYVDITVEVNTLSDYIWGRTATLSPFVFAVPNPGSGVGTEPENPAAYALHQNIPNPFNPSTVIRYDVPIGGERVTLQVYDVRGQLVATLVDAYETAGQKSVEWNGRNQNGRAVATGIYFCRMTAGDFNQTRKMILLK
jgi:parallel beta-helix repeat protein